MSQFSVLNTDHREEEEVLDELTNHLLIHNEEQMNEYPAKEIPFGVPQINSREGEIKELKEENYRLKQEVAQSIDEKNEILNERQQLQKKVSELKQQVT